MKKRTHTLILSSLLSLSLLGPALAERHHHSAPAKDASAVAVPTKDGPLSFTRLGKGPPVVLLHGLGGDRAVWADEMVRLSPKYTVVAVDLPGHGLSPAPSLTMTGQPAAAAPPAQPGQPGQATKPAAPAPASPPVVDMQKVAMQVAKLIRDQHLAPAVLVGHSMGGDVAAWVAVLDREAVRGVLMVDSFLSPLPFSEAERTRLRADLRRDQIPTLRRFFGPITSSTNQLDKMVASAQRVTPAVFMGYLDYLANNELDDRVREIQVPVHLLAGPALIANNNEPAKAQQALQAAGYQSIPGFTYEYFPASKHWLFWDEPERFRAAMDKFLGAIARPAVSSVKTRTRL